MSWTETLNEKIRDLELIAQWASMTDQGNVRDYCRLAIAELKRELERVEGKR